jgi:hypothetical protein
MAEENKNLDHLYAVLFRESKIIVKKYEDYLRDKITSKQLAQCMLSLKDALERIENQKNN